MINGLELKKIRSEATLLNNIDSLDSLITNYFPEEKVFMVAYLDNEVLIDIYEKGQWKCNQGINLNLKYTQKIRLFNESREILIWKTNKGLKGRIRIDNEGEEIEVVDANLILFGTSYEVIADCTRIYEKRGTEITLPFKNFSVDSQKRRVAVVTRNYIDYNGVNQATYIDCRFLEFSFQGSFSG